jgi:hypothetical protein
MHHNITYLRVYVTYRRVLDWWPDLLHTYTTFYHNSHTTIKHIMSSLRHHLRLPPQELPQLFFNYSIILIPQSNHSAGLGHLLYRLRADPQKAPSLSNSSIVAPCCGNVFTAQFPMDISCGSTIPAFRRHVTITFHLQLVLSQHWYAISFFVIYFRPVVRLFHILCCSCFAELHVNHRRHI